MCMCIEFVIHVPKHKSVHVPFLVGMVVSVVQARIGLLWEMLR